MVDANEQMIEAGRRFLETGERGSYDFADLIKAADRLVRSTTQQSADEAVRLGRLFVKRTKGERNSVESTAYRSCGWAYLVAGRFAEAEKVYIEARARLQRDAVARASVDRVLIDVYMYLGRFDEARRRARMAMATFKRLRQFDALAKTRVNYANLLHRQDRHQEANKLYQEAAAYFEAHGPDTAVALCYYNQANTLVQLFDFEYATKLYTQARETFKKHGHDLHATGCLNGLAWLHMLEGNYHVALQELTECEQFFERAGQPRELVLCQLDRAEAYLGLNLFVDARDAAETAEKSAKSLGIRYEAAKGAFFLAKAATAMGQVAEAKRSLKRAEAGFKSERNDGFLAAVKLAQTQTSRHTNVDAVRISEARKRFAAAQLPLWEAICDLQILAASPDQAHVFDRLESNPAVKTVPHLFARRYTLLGDREAISGHQKKAIDYWTRAADVLDAVRAKLPPVDMRSSFFKSESNPYRKLILSQHESNPREAAVWAERFKTIGVWSTSDDFFRDNPARTRAERSLTELATQVTAVSGQIGDLTGERSLSISRSGRAFFLLQQQVRHDLAALEAYNRVDAGRSERLYDLFVTLSHEQPIVQFHVGVNDIIAFVHHRGETTSYLFADGRQKADHFIARWRFLIERAPYVNERQSSQHHQDETTLLQQMGEWLLAPLQLPSRASRITLLPEGSLASVPWQALQLHQRALVDSYEVIIAPSIRHSLHARRQKTRSTRVEVFIGATDGLHDYAHDYRTLAAAVGDTAIIHDPCSREDWPNNSKSRIWHFVGHANHRSDNPFYSSLLLKDGPMFAADFRLKHNTVGLVTLAACRTGQQTSLPGEEATGLVRSLLEMGARNVLASQWAVSDQSTALWMDRFYSKYLQGTPIGTAVREASQSVREKFPSAYHWGAFSVFGAGY